MSLQSISRCLFLLGLLGALYIGMGGCAAVDGQGLDFNPFYFTYKNRKVIDHPGSFPSSIHDIPSDLKTVDFFALGCAGTGQKGQKLVADAMHHIASRHPVDFVVYLGDNFYSKGVRSVTDKQWQKKFEGIYYQDTLQVPFYSILGNHDYHRNPLAQVEYSKISSRWKMRERYYGFQKILEDGTTIDFFALDTESLLSREDPDQMAWFKGALQTSTADWKIVLGHHPVYSGDTKQVKRMMFLRPLLEPLLMKYRVDLYLNADSHNIQVLKPEGHTYYVESGAGSKTRSVIANDDTLFAMARLGFLWVTVAKDFIQLQVVGVDGSTPFAYRIQKA